MLLQKGSTPFPSIRSGCCVDKFRIGQLLGYSLKLVHLEAVQPLEGVRHDAYADEDGPTCGFESSDPDPTDNGHVSRLSNPETKRFPLFRSRARLPAQVLTFFTEPQLSGGASAAQRAFCGSGRAGAPRAQDIRFDGL